jgi:hypothetical protein
VIKYSLARLYLPKDREKASHLIQQDALTAEDEVIPYLREPEYLIRCGCSWLRVIMAPLALSKRLPAGGRCKQDGAGD